MNYVMPDPNIEGWMGAEELQWLFARASEMDSVIEIGSWKGRSTHALLSGCKGKVFAVDHFRGSVTERDTAHAEAKHGKILQIFCENLKQFSNLSILVMDSIEASSHFLNRSVDMVFLDGDHTYPATYNDMNAWMPKCTKLFCGHDVGQDGIPRALKELGMSFKTPTGSLWSIEL